MTDARVTPILRLRSASCECGVAAASEDLPFASHGFGPVSQDPKVEQSVHRSQSVSAFAILSRVVRGVSPAAGGAVAPALPPPEMHGFMTHAKNEHKTRAHIVNPFGSSLVVLVCLPLTQHRF